MSLRDDVRAAISNAYYENRGAGQTMETAADAAVAAVMKLLCPADRETLEEDQRPVSLGSLEYDLSSIPGKAADVWAQTPDGRFWPVLVANVGGWDVATGRAEWDEVAGNVVLRLMGPVDPLLAKARQVTALALAGADMPPQIMSGNFMKALTELAELVQ